MPVASTMSERVDDFLAAAMRATWTEALWNLAIDFFEAEGVIRFSYHHLPPLGAPDTGRVRIVAQGFPQDWVATYIRKKYYAIDPIPAQALSQETPFRWSEIAALRELSEREIAYLKEMEDAAPGDGLALQSFGPGGRNGYFGIGDRPGHPLWTDPEIRNLQAACQFSHLRYCRLLRDTMPAAPALSDRERELLYWVAQGKSNGVIAEIMGVSPHTVDAYMRRVFLKLGTTDRISAAIRGMATNIIPDY